MLLMMAFRVAEGSLGILPGNNTESPIVLPPPIMLPPRLRSPTLPSSLPIEIPSPRGSPLGRFRLPRGSSTSTPSDFVRASVGGVSWGTESEDSTAALNKAELELRATWDLVKEWESISVGGSSYEEIIDTLSRSFEIIRSLIAFNATLLQETTEVEEGIKALLEPPRSSRNLRRGFSPAITMHFEFLIKEFNKRNGSLTGASLVDLGVSSLSDSRERSRSRSASGATAEDNEDDDAGDADDDLHFPIDE